jgi:hypothetical protein
VLANGKQFLLLIRHPRVTHIYSQVRSSLGSDQEQIYVKSKRSIVI